MPKPPETPPSSDIEGVHRDRVAIDAPANAKADPGKKLQDEESRNKARPKGSRS